MRNGCNELSTVDQVIQKLPAAGEILRAAHIDRNTRLNLRQAARAASIEPDELLARIEIRARREAQAARAAREAEVELEELEYA